MRLAEVAAVLADRSRATMCVALLDGRAWTVSELAGVAQVAHSTASEHVQTLVAAGFVRALKQGRHRYVRLADSDIAELIERLASHAGPESPRGLRASVRDRRLAQARTCYDHLAGRLGVALRDGMIAQGLISERDGLVVTALGRNTLADLGIEPVNSRRTLLRDCLDWTERRQHLAGALPAAILHRALTAGWLTRGGDRAITVHEEAWRPLERLGLRAVDAGSQASHGGVR
nr:helix-turn-helix domain-containing protein [Pseudonocardia sp. TRM90224]